MWLFVICPTDKRNAKCHWNKCKGEHHAKYQHFTSCSFTVFNKLKALQLSTVGLSAIKHQHSKKAYTMDRSHLNQKHMKNASCLQEFVHKSCSKCSPFARTHAWRHFLHWSSAMSIMTCRKSGHTAIKHSFSSLRTVNEQKAKCWYFAWF